MADFDITTQPGLSDNGSAPEELADFVEYRGVLYPFSEGLGAEAVKGLQEGWLRAEDLTPSLWAKVQPSQFDPRMDEFEG